MTSTIARRNARNETSRRPGNKEHYCVVYTARYLICLSYQFLLNLIRGIREKIRKSIEVSVFFHGVLIKIVVSSFIDLAKIARHSAFCFLF